VSGASVPQIDSGARAGVWDRDESRSASRPTRNPSAQAYAESVSADARGERLRRRTRTAPRPRTLPPATDREGRTARRTPPSVAVSKESRPLGRDAVCQVDQSACVGVV